MSSHPKEDQEARWAHFARKQRKKLWAEEVGMEFTPQKLVDYAGAIEFAVGAHDGQRRKYEDRPYVLHPIRVSRLLMDAGADADEIIAGVLHDTLEDSATEYQDLLNLFGPEVADIVADVTKPNIGDAFRGNVVQNKSQQVQAQMTKVRTGTVSSVRVKLADRLDNLYKLAFAPASFQKSYVANTHQLLGSITDEVGRDSVVDDLKEEILGLIAIPLPSGES